MGRYEVFTTEGGSIIVLDYDLKSKIIALVDSVAMGERIIKALKSYDETPFSGEAAVHINGKELYIGEENIAICSTKIQAKRIALALNHLARVEGR